MTEKAKNASFRNQQFRPHTMGRALSMIARRQVDPAISQMAVTVAETAAPAEPCKKGCHSASIAAL